VRELDLGTGESVLDGASSSAVARQPVEVVLERDLPRRLASEPRPRLDPDRDRQHPDLVAQTYEGLDHLAKGRGTLDDARSHALTIRHYAAAAIVGTTHLRCGPARSRAESDGAPPVHAEGLSGESPMPPGRARRIIGS
jgi:hypothetical protein